MCVINHCTYLIGIQTDLGNTACAKRPTEKMYAKIQLTMVRLTNLNFMLKSCVFYIMWSDFNYVVLKSSKRLKQAATRSGLMKERPKVSNRRGLMEFGILQYLEKYGERKNRSTTFISRKGSSLTWLTDPKLPCSYKSQHLFKLDKDLSKGLKATNLSAIMSDPNFLITCWVRIKSNKNGLISSFNNSIVKIQKSQFTEIADTIKNGSYKFQVVKNNCILKPNNNKICSSIVPFLKDIIVQESMQFLLKIVFKSSFKKNFYKWKFKHEYLKVLNDIQMKCKNCTWYIKGNIKQQFLIKNRSTLMNIIKTKVNDQVFIDLLDNYVITVSQTDSTKIKVTQTELLLPILIDIYIYPFDVWVKKHLIPSFNKKGMCKNKSIKSLIDINSNWKQIYYFRYANNFIIGAEASKNDCLMLKNKINHFLQTKLNTILNFNKLKITNARKEISKFLGYNIHKSTASKISVKLSKLGRANEIASKVILNAPVKDIIKRLIKWKYATKAGKPTRNAKLVNHRLSDIINHYCVIERNILNYYLLANNYKNLAIKIHFILKYSCVLTIASKMKLKTKKKVFKMYGKDLKILDNN